METTGVLPTSAPLEVCGFPVDRALSPDHPSYLAIGPGGRGVALKKLDAECLLSGTLHPTVRDRLNRVRELAHPGVANLFGVGSEGADAYLIWEYVEGVAFEAYVNDKARTPREMATLARELILAVDLLHMQGIVHGALIGNNIIIAAGGSVRLTHISPLLYHDPAVDVECLLNLLEQMAASIGDQPDAFTNLLTDARHGRISLRQLATGLAALNESRDEQAAHEEETPRSVHRRRALIGAAVAVVLGLAIAWGVWQLIESGRFGSSQSVRFPFRSQSD
ncbi:MAG: serine/threonine protein kinase [Phycisphaerales bacterium]|jgi:serine/threonine protein kinase|nr:serine/threonine protein kinase [Phycisphaerales bacterium]